MTKRSRETQDRRRCREEARRRFKNDPTIATHGVKNTYMWFGCRCRPCTDAHSAHHLKLREQRRERLRLGLVEIVHGTASGYHNWGCTCTPCREAYRDQRRAYEQNARRRKQVPGV